MRKNATHINCDVEFGSAQKLVCARLKMVKFEHREDIATANNTLLYEYKIPTFQFALREDLKNEEKFLPTKSEPNATGWDVRAAQEDRKDIVLRAGQYSKIPIGFRIIAPQNWWIELRPRSSTFAKKYLHCLYGVLDQDWRGFCMLVASYLPDINSLANDLHIKFGEPIGQIIPVRRKEMIVESISNEKFDAYCKEEKNVRGTKGWGEMGGLK
jgi:dUTPase